LACICQGVRLWAIMSNASGEAASMRGPHQRMRSASLTSVAAAAASADTFDPWTVLGISPDAGQAEARKAYKKLMRKYHPDVDPSPEAAQKFEQIVRANAVVTGEDKDLDQATMLRNAVENLRNDIDFKRQQIEKMKADAAREEEEIIRMQADMEKAEETRAKVTQELSMFGGGALGLLVGGPTGLVVGAVLGLALKDRDDGAGKMIRSVGQLTKSVFGAVAGAANKKA